MIKHRPARHFIREWRIARGLTAENVASRLEVAKSAYWRLETGQGYTQAWLERVGRVLGVGPSDLINGPPPGFTSGAPETGPNPDRLERVARAIHATRAYMVGDIPPWDEATDLLRETATVLAAAALDAADEDLPPDGARSRPPQTPLKP